MKVVIWVLRCPKRTQNIFRVSRIYFFFSNIFRFCQTILRIRYSDHGAQTAPDSGLFDEISGTKINPPNNRISLTPFFRMVEILHKIWHLNYFLRRRSSYHCKAQEFRNWRAFKFFFNFWLIFKFRNSKVVQKTCTVSKFLQRFPFNRKL